MTVNKYQHYTPHEQELFAQGWRLHFSQNGKVWMPPTAQDSHSTQPRTGNSFALSVAFLLALIVVIAIAYHEVNTVAVIVNYFLSTIGIY